MTTPPARTTTASTTARAAREPLAARGRHQRWPAWGAAALALASASVTLFWTLGGTLLLDTVGGAPEDLAREHSPRALAIGVAIVLAKVVAALLALALLRDGADRVRRRTLLLAGGGASTVLLLWGGVSVLISALVLMGVITPDAATDEYALRWHVFLWDSWFVIWGALLAVAVARYRRRTS